MEDCILSIRFALFRDQRLFRNEILDPASQQKLVLKFNYQEVQTCQPPTVKNLEVDSKKPGHYATYTPLIGTTKEKKSDL